MKKSQARFLTKKELTVFEDMYQALKTFPGFKMENIFHSKTREYYGVYTQCVRELRLGSNKREPRLCAGVHEAGHAIVMAATYIKISEARIFPDGSGHVIPAGYKEEIDYEPLETMPAINYATIKVQILGLCSGFVAENIFTGFKSKAYHEIFLVYCQTRYLDEKHTKKALHHWEVFISWSIYILENNIRLFHVITEDILKHESMTPAVKDLLHSKVKKEPVNLFFN